MLRRNTLLYFFIFSGWLVSRSGYAQDLQLAQTYYKEGEWDKALAIYSQWIKKNTYRQDVYDALVDIYIKTGRYDEGLDFIEQTEKRISSVYQKVDKFHLHRLRKDGLDEKQWKQLQRSLKKNPNWSISAAYRLKKYHYLDRALEILNAYSRIRPSPLTEIQKAEIYAEKGDKDKMMAYLLQAVEMNMSFLYHVLAKLNRYITENPENPYNRALKKALLTKLKKSKDPVWLQLLQWLYAREKNYEKSFVMARALYLQDPSQAHVLMNLADDALKENKPQTALKIYDFILAREELKNSPVYENALMKQIIIRGNRIQNKDSLNRFIVQVKKTLPAVRYTRHKAELYKLMLDLYMYKMHDLARAQSLADSLATHFGNYNIRAQWEEYKGDILLLQKNFSEAAIVYTLLRENHKPEETGYRALYKIALASFFDGDFEWAHKNLKALKKATDKKIANDALLLDFMILANRSKDSVQTALRIFADTYFDYFAGHYQKVIRKTDSILPAFKGQKIYDDLLYLKAKSAEKLNDYDTALTAWKNILSFPTEKIHREEALYRIGIIFEKEKHDPESARKYFLKLLENYPQGFYFQDAQKHYRMLTKKE